MPDLPSPSGEPAGRLPLPLTAADRVRREQAIREIVRQIESGRYRVPADRVAAAVQAFHRREV